MQYPQAVKEVPGIILAYIMIPGFCLGIVLHNISPSNSHFQA